MEVHAYRPQWRRCECCFLQAPERGGRAGCFDWCYQGAVVHWFQPTTKQSTEIISDQSLTIEHWAWNWGDENYFKQLFGILLWIWWGVPQPDMLTSSLASSFPVRMVAGDGGAARWQTCHCPSLQTNKRQVSIKIRWDKTYLSHTQLYIKQCTMKCVIVPVTIIIK